MSQQLNLFNRRGRIPRPHVLSFKHISTETLGYTVHLVTFDDGTMTVGVGGSRKRMTAILTKEQVYELTRTLQSMQMEL